MLYCIIDRKFCDFVKSVGRIERKVHGGIEQQAKPALEALPKSASELVERKLQSSPLHDSRVQFEAQSADLRHRFFEHLLDFRCSPDDFRNLRLEVQAENIQLQPDSAQNLSDLIVQQAGDASILLLTLVDYADKQLIEDDALRIQHRSLFPGNAAFSPAIPNVAYVSYMLGTSYDLKLFPPKPGGELPTVSVPAAIRRSLQVTQISSRIYHTSEKDSSYHGPREAARFCKGRAPFPNGIESNAGFSACKHAINQRRIFVC
jgi:hypothetical protein